MDLELHDILRDTQTHQTEHRGENREKKELFGIK